MMRLIFIPRSYDKFVQFKQNALIKEFFRNFGEEFQYRDKARIPKLNRELKQTTTATATRTSPNERFNEQNNSSARAFEVLIHFQAVLCKTTTGNDPILRILDSVNHDGKFLIFLFGVERSLYTFSLSQFLNRQIR